MGMQVNEKEITRQARALRRRVGENMRGCGCGVAGRWTSWRGAVACR